MPTASSLQTIVTAHLRIVERFLRQPFGLLLCSGFTRIDSRRDACVALGGVTLHWPGRRKRPLATPHLSRPYANQAALEGSSPTNHPYKQWEGGALSLVQVRGTLEAVI